MVLSIALNVRSTDFNLVITFTQEQETTKSFQCYYHPYKITGTTDLSAKIDILLIR